MEGEEMSDGFSDADDASDDAMMDEEDVQFSG